MIKWKGKAKKKSGTRPSGKPETHKKLQTCRGKRGGSRVRKKRMEACSKKPQRREARPQQPPFGNASDLKENIG